MAFELELENEYMPKIKVIGVGEGYDFCRESGGQSYDCGS